MFPLLKEGQKSFEKKLQKKQKARSQFKIGYTTKSCF